MQKVLILGSGGLKIGQAGEFDYSGSQAIKALSEEGIESILINPNIATVQTSGLATRTYFLPVTPEFVEEVIRKESPEGILLSFGGQTALNCGLELQKQGILERYGVKVLGTPLNAIEDTEDRDRFVQRLDEIGVKTPVSRASTSVEAAIEAADAIGYPVMIRIAFALGGRGSGICHTREELQRRCQEAFANAPQVLIEEWLGGWKEVEYEVVRDAYDNCITVCNMENFDPLGIHTGESIVVAPSQTLNNHEYHKLRELATKVIRHLGIVGECNIQYALDPKSDDYRVIEVNARLSRSSALASKATGYPLAFVAAKLALGQALVDIRNKVVETTCACFEPALDYVVVKMPRWDLKKFKNVDNRLGSEMKSVGEVMAIGRGFEETLQKACRMVGYELINGYSTQNIDHELKHPTDLRVYAIAYAMRQGYTVEAIHELTHIDRWFLHKIKHIIDCDISLANLLQAKRLGFSDAYIAKELEMKEQEIRTKRKEQGILPKIKQIDTLAAEFPARTNYLYMTYNASENDVHPLGEGIVVLGGGAYRIGSSVEFDWCCVQAIEAIAPRKTIMVNYNPETVSTDYDVCDKLYFEEVSYERVLDIYEYERAEGVVLSMGGQIPNNLALPLHKADVNIIGTSPENIDRAESRHKFSALLDEMHIGQPSWTEVTSIEGAQRFAQRVGYPVLIRPSYVLSGAAMQVVWDDASLERFLDAATQVNPEHPVVVSKFIEGAKEIEIDAVAKQGELLIYAMSEHIENAGVHSGDATVVLPAQRLYVETTRQIKRIARKIAKALNITGPFNIQFLAYENQVRVIECNLRASRSFPFCSKVFKQNMITLAVKAMLEEEVSIVEKSLFDLDHVGVKAAQFSFGRLKGSDPVSGVEMASTGEVACIGREVSDALLKAMLSVGFKVPQKAVLLSSGPAKDKALLLQGARQLQGLGLAIHATAGTAKFLLDHGITCKSVRWPLEGEDTAIDLIRSGNVDLVVNIPKSHEGEELRNDYMIRRAAVDYNVPLITEANVAKQFIDALEHHKQHGLEYNAWEDY